MTDRKRHILAALADGEFHSGQQLADRTGVSRSAIWKHVRGLAALGLDLERVRGRGYRLPAPLELLDAGAILERLEPAARRAVSRPEILFETASTNQYLLEELDRGTVHGRAVLAEYQTAGRGRGENRWLAGPATGLCLSLGWHYAAAPASLTALSLATGVALIEALEQAGCRAARLKWPNDVVADGAKLAGILIESRAQGGGACDVVIGIGVNVRLPERLERSLDRKVTDLERLLGPGVLSRNALAAAVVNRLVAMLDRFGREGFTAFIDEWRRLDACSGREALLLQGGRRRRGRVLGIDESGLLLMEVDGETRKFSSGELSLRVLE